MQLTNTSVSSTWFRTENCILKQACFLKAIVGLLPNTYKKRVFSSNIESVKVIIQPSLLLTFDQMCYCEDLLLLSSSSASRNACVFCTTYLRVGFSLALLFLLLY